MIHNPPQRTPCLAELQAAQVLVVGDAILDRYWHGLVERISPEAPVPVVRVNQEEERLGGAANVAYNIANLGVGTSFLSVIGKDVPGATLRHLLGQKGMVSYLVEDAQLTTTVKLRVIGRQQQLLRVDFENTPSPQALDKQFGWFVQLLQAQPIPGTPSAGVEGTQPTGPPQVLLFSDYGKGALAQIHKLLPLAREAGCPILVDPKGNDYSRYRHAHVITPNLAEFRQAVGPWQDEEELGTKAQNLRQSLQLETLLITRSEQGMSLFDAAGSLHLPTQAQEVFDVTGAGDTVVATLASLMAAGYTARQALPWANKAAGIVVSKLGTAFVTLEELLV